MDKYANVKTIKAKKTSISLAAGKTAQLEAKYKMYKSKKHLKKKYGTAL